MVSRSYGWGLDGTDYGVVLLVAGCGCSSCGVLLLAEVMVRVKGDC